MRMCTCLVHATVQVIYEAHKRSLQEWARLKSRVCWRRKLSHIPLPRWSARISHLSSNWARYKSTWGRMHVWLSMLLSMASRKCKRFREILARACALSLSTMFAKTFLFSKRNRCGCSLPTRSSMPTSCSVLLRSHVEIMCNIQILKDKHTCTRSTVGTLGKCLHFLILHHFYSL